PSDQSVSPVLSLSRLLSWLACANRVPPSFPTRRSSDLIPRWMNNPAYRQLMAGNFLDILFDCPYEIHNLTADPFISRMVEELSEDRKSTRLNSSHVSISYAVFCLKKKRRPRGTLIALYA